MFNFISGLSLTQKIMAICVLCSVFPVVSITIIAQHPLYYSVLLVIAAMLTSLLLARALTKPIKLGLQSLETGLLNFKDGELSSLLAYKNNDELGKLCLLYNQTAKQLRQEKQWIYQRELMLDKVLQSSPQALLLVNDNKTVVFSNLVSRTLFNSKTQLEGTQLHELLSDAPIQLTNAIEQGVDGLFNIEVDSHDSQTWHLSLIFVV